MKFFPKQETQIFSSEETNAAAGRSADLWACGGQTEYNKKRAAGWAARAADLWPWVGPRPNASFQSSSVEAKMLFAMTCVADKPHIIHVSRISVGLLSQCLHSETSFCYEFCFDT